VVGSTRRPSVPSSDAELISRIRNLVADALSFPAEEIGFDDHLYDTLGLDSLGTVALFIDLSYHFGTPEPERDFDFSSLYSVRLLVTYVRTFGNDS
jgi:acyl carrier protein